MATAMALAKRLEAATGRLCSSSPICRALAMRGFNSRPPLFSSSFPEGRRPDIPPEAQPLQRPLAVFAELLAAFHLPAEGPVAEGPVLHHPNGHGGGDRSRHGADGLMVMVRLEDDRSALEKLLRLLGASGPSFEDARPRSWRPSGLRTWLPSDGRTGVEDHPFFKPGITSPAGAMSTKIGSGELIRCAASRIGGLDLLLDVRLCIRCHEILLPLI